MWLIFFQLHPSVFDLLQIGLPGFFICSVYDLMTQVLRVNLVRNPFFPHFLLRFYHSTLIKKNDFVITFNFFFIDLSWSHYLDHEFCKLFWIEFKKNILVCFVVYLIFTDFLFNFIQLSFVL